MLDIGFLRSLGIKTDLLPKPRAEGIDGEEKKGSGDIPVAGEFMVPPEIMKLSEAELKRLIMDEHSQENPLKFQTPHGSVIAVYPYTAEGRYGIEMTAAEFLALLGLIKTLDAKPKAYKPHSGSWVQWYEA